MKWRTRCEVEDEVCGVRLRTRCKVRRRCEVEEDV